MEHLERVRLVRVFNIKKIIGHKTHAARKIESRYSVILSGTPLENKLEELYSIIQLVDQYALGPYYLFKDRHILCDENGKIIGYKNLNEFLT